MSSPPLFHVKQLRAAAGIAKSEVKLKESVYSTMSEPSSSYADIQPSTSSEEVDSLPSSSAGSTTSVSPSDEERESDAEREWRESLQQLELLLTMVLVPYLGKYFGRKCAFWGECRPAHESATQH